MIITQELIWQLVDGTEFEREVAKVNGVTVEIMSHDCVIVTIEEKKDPKFGGVCGSVREEYYR